MFSIASQTYDRLIYWCVSQLQIIGSIHLSVEQTVIVQDSMVFIMESLSPSVMDLTDVIQLVCEKLICRQTMIFFGENILSVLIKSVLDLMFLFQLIELHNSTT